MKNGFHKKMLSILLVAVIVFSMAPISNVSVSAAYSYNTFYANGKGFPNSTYPATGGNQWCSCGKTLGSSGHWCCWRYATGVYNYIWNGTTSCGWTYSTSQDMLRNVAAADRKNTPENMKRFFAKAELGALLRIDHNSNGAYAYDEGHSLVFLGNNSSGDGGYFIEGNYNGCGNSRIKEWKWSDLGTYTSSTYGRYAYIAYICWPNAPAYTTTPSKVTITNGSSFQAGDVKFTWSAASGATSFNIKIWKIESDATETLCYSSTGVSSGCTYNLENGNYRYVVQAVNSSGVTETEARLYVGQRFIPSTFFTYNGNLYEIYERQDTWEGAQNFCNDIGGHLVTITTQEEQEVIEEKIQNSQNQYLWIGASDTESEGTFKWVTDEIFDYTNWDTLGDNEPNDANGGEDFACIKTVDSSTNLMGSWNDSSSSNTYGYICEYENINSMEPSATTTYNGYIYDLYDYKLPAIQAELFAQRKGGHLVSLNSAVEEDVVEELISQGTMTYYWLGAMRFDVNTYKYSDNLVWSTGEEITYTNYGEGEPNNDGGEEWFLEYVTYYSGWNDCTNTAHSACSSGFIVERPVEYTVTYNFSEGINGPDNQIKLHDEAMYLSITIPEKEGYTFLGWSTNANATTAEYAPGDEYTLNEDITLYALWSLDHLHNYDYVTIQAPTCTKTGIAVCTCECGDEYTETIPATGHQNTMWITEQEPTCTVDGYKDCYCLDCTELIDTESIPATGHLNTTWVTEQEPTCDVAGYKDEYCLDCGEKVGTEEIPANGHTLSIEWTIDIAPTCTEDGSKSHHCTVCESKDDITVIASLGHDYKVISIEKEHPHTISYKCSRCTETKEETSSSADCAICNFSYTNIDDETCKITGYIGNATSFGLPGTIGGRTVTTTTTGAFKNNTTLASVTIENGVQGLGALAFLGCTSLSKVVIPESVTSIGANAFYNCASDFTIYCYRDTYAVQYAVDNSLEYVIMDIGATDNSTIDYANELIFISKNCVTSLDDILYVPSTSMAFAEASHISGNNELLGTGTKVTVFDSSEISSEYTVIVEGDTNGDSVCDVVDCVDVERASNGNAELTGAYAMAADSNSDDIVDINDYQAIVNRAVS